jgi:hypothetical protein
MRKVRQNIVVNKLELEGIFEFKDNPIQTDHRTFVSAKLMKKIQQTLLLDNPIKAEPLFLKSTQKLRERTGGGGSKI